MPPLSFHLFSQNDASIFVFVRSQVSVNSRVDLMSVLLSDPKMFFFRRDGHRFLGVLSVAETVFSSCC